MINCPIIALLFLPASFAAPLAACSPLELIIGKNFKLFMAKGCSNTTVARGTTEPRAPSYGIIVGDPLYSATKRLLPEMTAYSVNYPASFVADSKIKGATDTVAHINAQSKACADQKFVLVGYSQGADVMHEAAAKLDSALFSRIVALVMFGDPGNKGPEALSPLGGKVPVFPADLQTKLKENCAAQDPVCTNSGKNTSAHLTYRNGDYMAKSAAYIQKQFQTGGKAGASPSPNGGPNDKGDNTSAMQSLGKALGATPKQMGDLGKAMKGESRVKILA